MVQRRVPEQESRKPTPNQLLLEGGPNYVRAPYGDGDDFETGLFREVKGVGSYPGGAPKGLIGVFGGGGGGGGGFGNAPGSTYQNVHSTSTNIYTTSADRGTPDYVGVAFRNDRFEIGAVTGITEFNVSHKIEVSPATFIGGQSTFSASWVINNFVSSPFETTIGQPGDNVSGTEGTVPETIAINANYALKEIRGYPGYQAVLPMPNTPNASIVNKWSIANATTSISRLFSMDFGLITIGAYDPNGEMSDGGYAQPINE